MDKGKIAGGILSLTLVGLAIGYVVATGYLTIRYGLSTNAFDVTQLAREYRATIEEIDRLEGGDGGDPVAGALDSIAARIAAKMPPP